MGRVHHSFTPFTASRPHRGKRKGGVGDNAGAASALALKASLSALRVAPSAPSSLHLSSALSLTSLALGSGAGTVISQSLAMILAFHVSQDFMSDESMCSAGPCALPRCRDARGQTRKRGEEAARAQRRPGNFVPSGLTDLILMWATQMRARQWKPRGEKKSFDT